MTDRGAPTERDRWLGALTFSALLAALLAGAGLVEQYRPEVFYRLVTEDAFIEWATFWALAVGVGANAALAVRTYRDRGVLASCFPALAALFCFLVAGEEISWAQRLIGYRPPTYFLANNIQLEANLHNLLRSAVWSTGIEFVICGFGVVLPLLLLPKRFAASARLLGVYAPPLTWAPTFVGLFAFYVVHPFYLSEEVAEAAVGFALGAAAVWRRLEPDRGSERSGRLSLLCRPSALVAVALLVTGLGAATSVATGRVAADGDGRSARALEELEALKADFVAMRRERGGRFVTECRFHARLHSIDRTVRLPRLREGSFSEIAGRDSSERARYFLDPWDSPYWLSDQCDSAARYVLLYSFGPNRRRDSTHWEVGGDDLGVYAFHLGTPRDADWRTLAFPEVP